MLPPNIRIFAGALCFYYSQRQAVLSKQDIVTVTHLTDHTGHALHRIFLLHIGVGSTKLPSHEFHIHINVDFAGFKLRKVFRLEENALGADTISFLFTPDQATITLGNSDHISRQITCGLRGEWKESREGFFLMKTPPEKLADLDLIFGYDPKVVMFSGGWNGYNRFIFAMRGAALLCEFLFQIEFLGQDIAITLPFNDYLPRTECRDPKFVPPKIQLLGHACSE